MPDKTSPTLLFRSYRLLAALLYPVAVLLSWAAGLFGKADLFRERMGRYPSQEAVSLAVGRVVWIHAASAGEVNAVTPFCRALRKERPGLKIVITASSRTGRKTAREAGAADAAFLAPLDMPAPVRRAFRAFRPVLLIVAETEIWPLLFERASHNRVPLLLVNGRLSERHYPQYRAARSLFGPAVERFSSCMMQTTGDVERIVGLGAPAPRTAVAGQMKYDVSPADPAKAAELAKALALGPDDVLFTLGSVRDGEEDVLFPALPGLLSLSDRVRVLVAPRHMRNVPLYGSKLGALGLQWSLRSSVREGEAWRVLVLDTFGELTSAYALSRGAFVGGTLVPIGGHNLVEPALSRVPVCFGPHVNNVREAAEALTASGGGEGVTDAEGLLRVFRAWMDAGASREAGEKAFAAVDSMRGATERTLREILRYLPE